jgi:hypothetical protein
LFSTLSMEPPLLTTQNTEAYARRVADAIQT